MKMNSVWRDFSEFRNFPKLRGNIKTDVLIIGGGISGVLTAFLLKNKGVNCVVVEKDRICGGTTQNTTAKITYQHSLVYSSLIKKLGVERAQGYLLANKEAFDKYAELCRNIDCDYEKKDSYVYSLRDKKRLDEELDALAKIGYSAEFCKDPKIPIKTFGSVVFRDQAQFNPLKFLSKISEDLEIYENTLIKDIIDSRAIGDFGQIEAENIVVATHFPFIDRFGGYFLKLYQHRSYVIALEGAENVDGMYVDEAQDGLSFRNYKNLLFIGGGDHRTGKKGGKYEEIRMFARKYYPNATEKYFWATQDCMSLDGAPYIGKYASGKKNLYVITGLNKWGMTGAMTGAKIVSDMILGRKNEFYEVFAPDRSILHGQLFINGFETLTNLVAPTKRRCTHLGCALKWNSAEHTWDCACHGSRFSESGEVIDNPANKRL